MNGILKSDDMITRFFRIATQMCIENVYQQLTEDRMNPPPVPPKRDKYYTICDSFIKLVSLLIKNTADGGNPTPKLNLLNKVCDTFFKTKLKIFCWIPSQLVPTPSMVLTFYNKQKHYVYYTVCICTTVLYFFIINIDTSRFPQIS